MNGMQNYYADNCVKCQKPLTMQGDGTHEDEWHRGYCKVCSAMMSRNMTLKECEQFRLTGALGSFGAGFGSLFG